MYPSNPPGKLTSKPTARCAIEIKIVKLSCLKLRNKHLPLDCSQIDPNPYSLEWEGGYRRSKQLCA